MPRAARKIAKTVLTALFAALVLLPHLLLMALLSPLFPRPAESPSEAF